MADEDVCAAVKAAAMKLLDADKDGRLTYKDAVSLACSMQSGITASAKKSVLAWLDADGDGSVSIAEAEQGARAGLHRCEEKLSAVCGALAPFKDSLVMGGGFIGCFYGRNFKYTILFGRTFVSTGWPTLQPALRELGASYQRGKRAYRAAAPELSGARETLAKLQRDVSEAEDVDAAKLALSKDAVEALALVQSLGGVASAVEPAKLFAVFKGAYVGLSTSFAGVLSESAARIGVGVGLGDAIANAVNSFVSPLVSRWLSKARDTALESDEYRQAVEVLEQRGLSVDDEALKGWVDVVIKALSTALGVYVAHRVDDVVYLYSACVVGATVGIEGALHLVTARLPDRCPTSVRDALKSERTKQILIVGCASAGFFYQKVMGGGTLPFVFALPLTPVSILESFLNSMAMGIRATSCAA